MSVTHHSTSPRILVFDSGVGGLSIVQEIQKKLPGIALLYASDNAFFPYGTKGEAELVERVDAVLHGILESYAVDIIVVACNTASTLALPHIRNHFSQPVVGVVPAIKPAAALTKGGVIGLLATPATVARPYTHNLIREYAAATEVISVGSSALVQIAERKLRGEILDAEEIKTTLQPFFDHPLGNAMDVLVLACTHFPLLREELSAWFSPQVQLIDSGEAIARRVVSLLTSLSLNSGSLESPDQLVEHRAIFTKASESVTLLGPQLATFGIHHTDIINI